LSLCGKALKNYIIGVLLAFLVNLKN